MTDRILFVDDDANVLAAQRRLLRGRFEMDSAQGGEEALRAIDTQGPYAVVVADMRMPGMDGVELLRRVMATAPNTVRVMLTGNADLETAMQAVNQGSIFRFITKPCPPETLVAVLQAAIHQHRLIVAERELLEKTLGGSIMVLTEILSLIDPRTFGRTQTLREQARQVAAELRIEDPWALEVGAMLAPIGLVTVPPVVMARARRGSVLTGAEKDMLARVAEAGHHLLAHIPRLEAVAEIVKYQGKGFDGSGLPKDDVAGTAIPLGARILRVLLDLNELEAEGSRPQAFATMAQRGGVYDPDVLRAARACLAPAAAAAAGLATPPVGVRASQLRAGHVLAADIVTSDGAMLLQAGQRLSEAVLARLRNFVRTGVVQEPIYVMADGPVAAAVG